LVTTSPNSNFTSVEEALEIEPAFLGDQDKDLYIYAGETKYFYFHNWRLETITFALEFLGEHYTSNKNIKLSVQVYDHISSDGIRVP